MTDEALVEELIAIVGADHVSTADEVRLEYGQDALKQPVLPDVVVWPGSTEEISAILKLANRERFFVTPRAGGVGYTGGAVPVRRGVLLSVARLNRIVEINEAARLAVGQPGVVLADFQRSVEARGLFYPPDPSSLEECMLGGNIAENAGGPRCVKYGVTGAYVLGLTFVAATGEIVNSGGRTTKNVVGFDLTSLFVGSEGMLGIATEITLRLLPLPEARRTLSVTFASVRDAARCVTAITMARVIPAKLELIDRVSLNAVAAYTGESMPSDVAALLLVEVDGSANAVQAESLTVERVCRDAGAIDVVVAETDAEADRLWAVRRKISPAIWRLKPTKLNEDVVVPRSLVPDLLDGVAEIASRHNLLIPCFGHAGDGNIHVNIMLDPADADELARGRVAVEEVLRAAVDLGGTISGEHGIGYAKAPYLHFALTRETIEMMRRVKETFDPNGILNPGKVFFSRTTDA
jgi:glycolate oxidase